MSKRIVRVIVVVLVAALGVAFTEPIACADEWVSTDGTIEIQTPPSGLFRALDDCLVPVIAQWDSEAKRAMIAIVVIPNPGAHELTRAGIEKGFAKELNGEILSSEQRSLSGVPVFRMTCKSGPDMGELYCMQSVFAVRENVYKIVAMSPLPEALMDPDIVAVFDSLVILKPESSGTEPVDPLATFSEKVGGPALLLLIFGLALYMRRKKRRAAEGGLK